MNQGKLEVIKQEMARLMDIKEKGRAGGEEICSEQIVFVT